MVQSLLAVCTLLSTRPVQIATEDTYVVMFFRFRRIERNHLDAQGANLRDCARLPVFFSHCHPLPSTVDLTHTSGPKPKRQLRIENDEKTTTTLAQA